MNILHVGFMQAAIRMCDDGWRLGWHECHGGNLSYRLSESECDAVKIFLDFSGNWVELDVRVPALAGDMFLFTGSGKCFRNAAIDPENALGIIEINGEGNAYRKLWGFSNGGRPTSELSPHLMNHEIKKNVSGGRCRIIYHAHPENIIALSFVLPLRDEIFTRELWEMMPECAMTFQTGMGVIPWMVPGTKEVALLTGEMMKRFDVVLWAQHGLFSSGESFDAAFGLMNTVEKAASMLLKVMAVPDGKRQAPSVQNFRDMAKVFHLELPERFLYEKEEI